MAVLADIELSSGNPHPPLIVDQLRDLIPLDYHELLPLGSSIIKLLCMDDWYGVNPSQRIISIDPAYLSWLPDYLEVLDDDYHGVMAVVNGIEENGAMHNRRLDAGLEAIGQRGFGVRINRLPEYGKGNAFQGLDLLAGQEYLVYSHATHRLDSPQEAPLVYTATPDGLPIDLRDRLVPVNAT